jgi:hypothetical protein
MGEGNLIGAVKVKKHESARWLPEVLHAGYGLLTPVAPLL